MGKRCETGVLTRSGPSDLTLSNQINGSGLYRARGIVLDLRGGLYAKLISQLTSPAKIKAAFECRVNQHSNNLSTHSNAHLTNNLSRCARIETANQGQNQ